MVEAACRRGRSSLIMSASARARKWTDKLGLELHQRQQSIRQLGIELFQVLSIGTDEGYELEVRIVGRQWKTGQIGREKV